VPARRVLGYIACSAAALYIAFLAWLYFEQTSIIYPGAKNHVDAHPPQAPGLEAHPLPTSAGHVEALFLPAEPAPDTALQPVMIFGHGRTAMDATFDRIARDPRVDRTRIFGFGQSLGGGAICLLARDPPLRALILQSTFPSLDIFTASYGAPAFLLRDHFDNLAALAHFSGPVLVIHGRQDQLIPWEQGQRLALASAHSTFRVYDCGHGCWDPVARRHLTIHRQQVQHA
jgi:fermentation-respiration switch protein FrsA (DUF1100 family)